MYGTAFFSRFRGWSRNKSCSVMMVCSMVRVFSYVYIPFMQLYGNQLCYISRVGKSSYYMYQRFVLFTLWRRNNLNMYINNNTWPFKDFKESNTNFSITKLTKNTTKYLHFLHSTLLTKFSITRKIRPDLDTKV